MTSFAARSWYMHCDTLAFRNALSPSAADFPRKHSFVIPYAAGGGFDTYVRVVGPVMESICGSV